MFGRGQDRRWLQSTVTLQADRQRRHAGLDELIAGQAGHLPEHVLELAGAHPDDRSADRFEGQNLADPSFNLDHW
jgi:hypothetical protein